MRDLTSDRPALGDQSQPVIFSVDAQGIVKFQKSHF